MARDRIAGDMDRDEFLNRLESMTMWRSGGERAPHKPLLLLLALGRVSRDPRFRHRVLRAYERRCAVCGFDLRVEDQLLGLEAAHIKWHAAGGPDTVANGLALCSLHHKALDVGALGLDAGDDGVVVRVSSEVNGRRTAVAQLLAFSGAPLRPPRGAAHAPSPEYVAWHGREVFRTPALAP